MKKIKWMFLLSFFLMIFGACQTKEVEEEKVIQKTLDELKVAHSDMLSFFVRTRPCFGYSIFRNTKNGISKRNKSLAMRIVKIDSVLRKNSKVIKDRFGNYLLESKRKVYDKNICSLHFALLMV